MSKPAFVLEVFLQPGETYFGDESSRIRTLLGSCVSVTFWHPLLRLGGMCHYLLAQRPRGDSGGGGLDGRYGDEAIEILVEEMKRAGTKPSEYVAKLFGGGHMFSAGHGSLSKVPDENVGAGLRMVRSLGCRLDRNDLGGEVHRNIVFDVWSGYVWVRRGAALSAQKEPA